MKKVMQNNGVDASQEIEIKSIPKVSCLASKGSFDVWDCRLIFCVDAQDKNWLDEPEPYVHPKVSFKDTESIFSDTSYETMSKHSMDAKNDSVLYSDIIHDVNGENEESDMSINLSADDNNSSSEVCGQQSHS